MLFAWLCMCRYPLFLPTEATSHSGDVSVRKRVVTPLQLPWWFALRTFTAIPGLLEYSGSNQRSEDCSASPESHMVNEAESGPTSLSGTERSFCLVAFGSGLMTCSFAPPANSIVHSGRPLEHGSSVSR